MYSREIGGEEFTFGVSGKLIMNVLVMYDRQTGSLWSQLIGEAVEGDLKGSKLEFLPSWQTTWADWRETHPDTVALSKGFPGDSDPYNSYYASGRAGVIGESTTDDRLYIKEFVIGVEHGDEAVAYPFSVLNDEPVVNDSIGDTSVLVVFNKETGTGVVFDRSIEGDNLIFSSNDGLELIDEQTGTKWNGLTGEAIDGPLVGKTLERLKSTSSFWFGWKDFHPDTRIYGLEDPFSYSTDPRKNTIPQISENSLLDSSFRDRFYETVR